MNPNVKYELLELERLMGSSPESPSEVPQTVVRNEVIRIKQTLVYEVFHFEDERHLERYIQYHQQSLIRLMDHCAIQLETPREDPLRRTLYEAFNELLSFVERHFTKYFDQDSKAPESYLAIARKDALDKINTFRHALVSMNADGSLTELVLRVMQKVADSNIERGTTYRKVLYAKEVQKELNRITAAQSGESNVNDELRHLMYYLNYNSIKVVTWHAHYISSLLDKNETRTEKIETLSFLLKNINQAQVKPGVGYNLHAPSLRTQLNEYISVELEYHERLQHLSNRPAGTSPDDFLSGFKLKFEASVSQLAYLLKILIEMKIIVNNNVTQIIHFLVRFAITRKSEGISVGSLRSKFYNVESGTKVSVRNMLLSMIHYIEKN